MGDITVANIDYEMLSDVKDALEAATLSGVDIFEAVRISTKPLQIREAHLDQSPIAAVRHIGTHENDSLESDRIGHITCEITVAAKVALSSPDEATAVQELLRLVNLAKNAVEATPPSDATAIGDDDYYHRKIEWGDPSPDTSSQQPWVLATIPVEFGFSLDTPTSH